MKRIIFLFLLGTICAAAFSQQIERVSPVLGSDEQANEMILYVSENLRLMVPTGHDLSTVNARVSCKITVDVAGRVSNIDIRQNGPFWVDMMIIDAMKVLPPWFGWRGQDKYELSKELVFHFGDKRNWGGTYGYQKDRVNQQIGRSIEVQRAQNVEKMTKHWQAWEKTITEGMKLAMPLSPDNKPPMTNMPDRKPITAPPTNLPPVQVSLE